MSPRQLHQCPGWFRASQLSCLTEPFHCPHEEDLMAVHPLDDLSFIHKGKMGMVHSEAPDVKKLVNTLRGET